MTREMFEASPEYEDWIQETGGRDEDYDEYYKAWHRRVIEGIKDE